MSMKNFNDTIENRTHDLPACTTVPQPTAPPCNPCGSRIKKEKHSGYLLSIRILRKVFTDKFDDAHEPNKEVRNAEESGCWGAKYSFYPNLHDVTTECGERAYSQRLRLLTWDKQTRAMSDSRFAITRPTHCHVMRNVVDELCSHLRNPSYNNT
jgi:hypothetical protein